MADAGHRVTKVAVSGAAGRMGRMISAGLGEHPEFDVVCRYAPGHGDEGFSEDPADTGEADVVVEVTRPGVVDENLRRWHEHGSHVVVGTSGFDSERLAALREHWSPGPPNCLVVPNFSIGAVLMMRFAAEAAGHFAAVEIVELHHDGKVDAPSGTALGTAARLGRGGGDPGSSEPARGREVEGVRIHSVRLPGLLAHQEVLFGNPGEVLTIRHDTTDRSAFLPGVILAIRRVPTQPEPVMVGLEHLV